LDCICNGVGEIALEMLGDEPTQYEGPLKLEIAQARRMAGDILLSFPSEIFDLLLS
jgi:hypothetical protein